MTGHRPSRSSHRFRANSKTRDYHYRKWYKVGSWRRINTTLRKRERQQRGWHVDPTAGAIDTQSVNTSEAGGERGHDAGKRSNGRKWRIVVDTVGDLLDVVVVAARLQDYHGAKPLLLDLMETVTTLRSYGPTASTTRQVLSSGFAKLSASSWKSSSALLTRSASRFCHVVGSSNAPLPGWDAIDDSAKTMKSAPRVAKVSSTSLLFTR